MAALKAVPAPAGAEAPPWSARHIHARSLQAVPRLVAKPCNARSICTRSWTRDIQESPADSSSAVGNSFLKGVGRVLAS